MEMTITSVLKEITLLQCMFTWNEYVYLETNVGYK